jgi:NAD(P)-dependent dehydrogenase (short-subunit alcohol dehydrogenase family)
MATRLENKTALVTGATSNIGRAIALAFGAEGAHVAVAGRDRRRGTEVVEEIRASGGRAELLIATSTEPPPPPARLPSRPPASSVAGLTFW